MLCSMTGFGSCSVSLPTRKITVDVKSLNSKQLDLNCRVPSGLRSVEPEIRNLVAAIAERGKVDLSVSTENTDGTIASRLNIEAISAYKAQIEQVSRETGLPLPDDWYAVLLRLPDAITSADDHSCEKVVDDETRNGVLEATKGALNALMEFRRSEGLKLEKFFALRIERIKALLTEVPKFETERTERIKTRLADALAKIPNVEYDKGRLEQEMIYYIEKLDVNEEKQRLAQHLEYFMETMNAAKPGQGKKLGFIAQEMTREINTLGSKSNHAEMQNLVVRMKDEVEQIKEQVLNVM